MKLRLLVIPALAGICSLHAAGVSFQNFITARDGKLFDGQKEFRFLSWNIPNLLIIEDNFAWNAPNDWRLPDEFELNDAFATTRQLGGTVARTYSIPIQRADENAAVPKYVRANGNYNEDGFRTMDLALKLANDHGVRLIIPLINNWPWQGGREDLAAWLGASKDDFWTDPRLIADFEELVRHVLTRTNSLTGIRYCDDKSVLCWETGNELASPPEWTQTIARFIKSVDTNHLVMDGFAGSVRTEVLAMPEVDIVTTHHYPSGDRRTMAEQIRDEAKKAAGKKVYIVGEFGFVKTGEMLAAMDAIADSGASGGLLWSLRFRNRDGGFYWHSEPDGANLYKAFHWPPSPVGDAYDETRLMSAVREKAFAIRGLPLPGIPVPAAPKLLKISNAAAISWQGSVGAKSYQVERAQKMDGEWQIVASNVDEAITQYRPQFADENVPSGKWFYRVRAKNDAGTSAPSNIESVRVENDTVVDELADFSKTFSHGAGWKIENGNCRVAKEDIHRAAGSAGDALVYQLPSAVESFRVFAYFEKEAGAVRFAVSDDGNNFHEVAARAEDDFRGAGEYGYWKPVLFQAEKISAGKFFKIEPATAVQIGRVEISYPASQP